MVRMGASVAVAAGPTVGAVGGLKEDVLSNEVVAEMPLPLSMRTSSARAAGQSRENLYPDHHAAAVRR